jgi:signal transduction histidine kinase
LEILADRRLEILNASMDLREHGPANDGAQTQYSLELSAVAPEYNDVMQKMQQGEQHLLNQRIKASDNLFKVVVSLLCATFALAIALLWMHYRFLTAEAGEREKAELQARDSEEASRQLSVRVLQLQDEERRRFSRELHDGLGQSLTVAKMMAESLMQQSHDDATLSDLVSALDEALSETRTISYLLHPPLLDELGLASATKWYLEGFAKRTGIAVSVDVSDGFPRLPAATELALFRVLQESLTNIHRHSKCSKVHVSLAARDRNIYLVVKDNGGGIPPGILERFQSSGTHVGVGLAGMRERIREHGGEFSIESDGSGTEVSVVIPLAAGARPSEEFAAAN